MIHKQRKVTHPESGETISIDVRLVVFILQLWRLGFRTYQSCQNVGRRGCQIGYVKLAQPGTPTFEEDKGKAFSLAQVMAAKTNICLTVDSRGTWLGFKTKDVEKGLNVLLERQNGKTRS